jgi:kumamolisin
MTDQLTVIPGSARVPVPGATRIGDAYPYQQVRVTVVLRRAAPRPGAPADPEDIEHIERFAYEHGLAVTGINAAARSVGLLGTVAQMNGAFGVDLGEYLVGDQTYRGREGAIHVPATLADRVVAVLGLDNRPQAVAHFRVATPDGEPPPGFTPPEIAQRYGFPSTVDGRGQTVAVIELGGGYRTADLVTYFEALSLASPLVSAVSVDTAGNSPGADADAEVMLDIEVIGAVAPGVHIAVYFAPNTTNGFYDAVATALHDRHRKPSVISISWGAAEPTWTAQALDAYDALFADAATRGVTIYAAAGDDGSADRAGPGDHVDFPAASPSVVACGGTRLDPAGEVVWNESATGHGATGGGVSVHFGQPEYQAATGIPANPDGHPGRGVPDVAGVADPLTGYRIRVNGEDLVIGGTSAVAPLWAGLTALANKINGAGAGDPHGRLYTNPAAFTDITSGDNGSYHAGPGWDACTGFGSPIGGRIVQALGSA